MQVGYGKFKVETCKKCGRIVGKIDADHNTVKAVPHVQCQQCGNIVCLPCTTSIKNMRKIPQQQCPVCGFNGKNN